MFSYSTVLLKVPKSHARVRVKIKSSGITLEKVKVTHAISTKSLISNVLEYQKSFSGNTYLKK